MDMHKKNQLAHPPQAQVNQLRLQRVNLPLHIKKGKNRKQPHQVDES